MGKSLNFLLGFLFIVVLIVASGAYYTIDETEQVVVTQFGKLVGNPIKEPGLHFKLPFVETANRFDKRILQWDGDANQIPTEDKRFIWVDTTARWQIVDPLMFMQSVRTEANAQTRLDDIIDASTRDIISSHRLVEVIRDSNRLLEEGEIDTTLVTTTSDLAKIALERIKIGREGLSREIRDGASEAVSKFGIHLVDVRIKRINYVEKVRMEVYERMKEERRRAAQKFRSEGKGKKAEIEGQMTKELKEIQAEAYRKSQELSGKADAKAIKIYADAYNKDPEFYAFMKTLETYKTTIGGPTHLILSTDNEFYQRLNGLGGDKNQPPF